MAARYFVGGGTGNWNSTTNWSDTSGGASGFSFPINGDTVFLDAASGTNTLTINVTSACTSITCTGFTGTLAGTSQLTVAGSVTLDASMTFTWSGLLIITATNTFTSNGVVLNDGVTFSSAGTLTTTLADDLNITGTMSCTGAGTKVFNGNTIYLATSHSSSSAISGTTQFIMNGTGTLNNSDTISCNFDIDTTGGITIANFEYSTGTFRVLNGDNTHTGNLFIPISATLDIRSLVVRNLDIDQNTVTLLSDFYVSGELQLGRLGTVLTISGFSIIGLGNLFLAHTSNFIGGTTNIIMAGFGTVRSSNGVLRNNLTFKEGSRYNFISSTFAYNTGIFTIENGAYVSAKNTNLSIGISSTFININLCVFRTIIIAASQTITMNEFFSGSAEIKTRITSTSTSNYIISFTDNFEKISKFIKISNCTITNRNQLLIITDLSNAGSNLGIRYINNIPNGISKGLGVSYPPCYGIDDGFVNDPITKF